MGNLRQFAVLRNAVDLPDYKSISLKDGMVLSCHKQLPVYINRYKGIILIGYAWQTLPDKKDPVKEIESKTENGRILTEAELYEMENSWCGTYVLVYQGKVYQDATGFLNVFYSEVGFSSDLSLLAKAMDIDEVVYETDQIINWLPGPYTQYVGINKLLNSQVYDYRTGEVTARPLLPVPVTGITDKAELTKQFCDVFANSLHNLWSMFPDKEIMVGLTGGMDSRALLATAYHENLPFIAYTMDREDIFRGDVEIPKQICERLSIPYEFYTLDKSMYSKAREEEFIRNNSGLERDADRMFYANGQYDDLQKKHKNVILLRSGIWARVADSYAKDYQDNKPDHDLYDRYELPKDALARRAFDAYFKWVDEHPEEGLTLANRFYWEQREGCWLSYIEYGMTFFEDIITLQPLNSRLLLSYLAAYPASERIGKHNQEDIINYLCPEISDIPFSNHDYYRENIFQKFMTKTRHGIKRLKIMGLRKTIRLYMDIIRDNAALSASAKNYKQAQQQDSTQTANVGIAEEQVMRTKERV